MSVGMQFSDVVGFTGINFEVKAEPTELDPQPEPIKEETTWFEAQNLAW